VVSVPVSGECFDLDRPGAVAAWNRALNERYAMENLREHPSRLVRWIEARRRARVAALVPAFDRALDLGAEDGSLAAAWRDKGRFVLLLDLDPRMLRRADGASVAADACCLPVAAGSFDVVVLSAILEHVVDPEACVASAVRVLRPGGRLVVYVPWDQAIVRLKRWARKLRMPLGKLHDGLAPGHLRCFTGARLRRLFAGVASRVRVRLDPFSLGYYVEAHVRDRGNA